MAFTASLKRLLAGLLFVMAIFLMILYFNETRSILKPASSFFVTNYETRHNKINPPEKTWSYKCVNNRCIRTHYSSKDVKRTTFLTCSMLCGSQTLWPEPTVKSLIGTNANSFRLADVKYKVQTPFKHVESLMENAFSIFLEEIKQIRRASGGKEKSDEMKSSTRSYRESTYAGISSSSSREIETPAHYRRNLTTVNIYVHVIKTADVHLTMNTDECYNMTLSNERQIIDVRIYANSFFGARHGLSTLQQLVWYDDEDEVLKIISTAKVEDCPKFPYRGLMLDTSRHYFSVDAIKRTLIGMSHSKLNRFHWHLTDSQSFPFVSKFYPELAKYGAYSTSEIYTHDDVKDIVRFAQVRGIQIIPEIDAPAHAGNGWQWGPQKGLGELSLCINQQPWNAYCGEPPCGQLNPKNNHTYLILQKLYQELLELTGPTDYFHLGGDEVNLECWSQYFNDTDIRSLWCDFMLQAHHRLSVANNGQKIKMAGVWSSGLTQMPCLPTKNFTVQVWGGSQWPENYQLLDAGYNIIMSHVDAWYLDCGFGNWRATGEAACSPYRTWQTVYKHKPWHSMRLNKQQLKQVLGGEVCLWTEQVDESVLDARLWPRSSALGERLWTDPNDENDYAISKETFKRFSIFRNRLVQLGIKAEPIFPKYCAQNQDECSIVIVI
ncbi:CLUMA_CG009718, isoform A [Clunio marinus]|uniref:Beta-hexosaminidase n=1 Tax=Clunio marinus TaxID=568069 RepID=A0A1J1I989_9DIPT|nr:CLUMA_CG009718, isoform A [Clunio marinus]